jgi:phosphatidylinositol glycan class B
MLVTDYLYYGRWILVPYKFIQVNLVRGISVFYGHHPWHWYFSQGVPALLAAATPLVPYGLWSARAPDRKFGYAGLGLLCVYSILAHKEFRFVYPIIPLLFIYAAHGMQLLWSQVWLQRRRSLQILILTLLVVPNLVIGPFVTSVHQSGVIQVIDWLRAQPHLQSIGFMMPCHSTPFWSRLHRRVPLWFLTCEPPSR